MSSENSFLTWLRHPGSIVLIIAVVLMFVVISEESQFPPGAVVATSSNTQSASMPSAPPIAANDSTTPAPSSASTKMGGELPKIVRQFAAPVLGNLGGGAKNPAGATARLQAPDLGSLLGRLEDKVRAEPANMGNRLLLAQTYNELGLGDKALTEVRAARKQDSTHARAKLVLASILSARENKEGLGEAKMLLEELTSSSETKQYLVSMYLGDTSIRLGDHAAALGHWQKAVDGMPISDNRRSAIEKRITDLSAKTQ